MRRKNRLYTIRQKRDIREKIRSMPQKKIESPSEKSRCKHKNEIIYDALKRLSDTYEIFLKTVYGEGEDVLNK